MFTRGRWVAAASGAALAAVVLAGAGTVQAAPVESKFAAGGSGSARVVCVDPLDGDERLGPQDLPTRAEPPVGPLLSGYRRTGNLTSTAFLDKYWNNEANAWKYPPDDGFARINGELDKHETTLRAGQDLDRFGSEYGSFLAPAGDRYAKRALPPQNLMTRDPVFPCGYHRYQVTRPFKVWQGHIAPWFEQPGGGRQILLDPALVNPGEGQRLNVKWLLEHDYLKPDEDEGRAGSASLPAVFSPTH
ncbi:TNT domain-containing protein [Embleya sp. NPDC055664]